MKKMIKLGVSLACVAVLGGVFVPASVPVLGATIVRAEETEEKPYEIWISTLDSKTGEHLSENRWVADVNVGESYELTAPEIPGYTFDGKYGVVGLVSSKGGTENVVNIAYDDIDKTLFGGGVDVAFYYSPATDTPVDPITPPTDGGATTPTEPVTPPTTEPTDPVTPPVVEPTEPVTPPTDGGNAEKPVEPVDPVTPPKEEKPVEPEKPAEPITPPTNSGETTKPVDKPTEPVVTPPTNGGTDKPVDKPTEPVAPPKEDKPTVPTTPPSENGKDKPVEEPTKPVEKPNTGKVDKPVVAEKVSAEKPAETKPAQTVKPAVEPQSTTTSTPTAKTLPNTGEASSILSLVGAGLMGLVGLKRKK